MENSDPSNLSAATPKDRQSAFTSLRHRDFRLLWMGQIVSVTGSQMQLAAINWHIYLLTHSAMALGLVGACRAVPIILCSLMGGVVADAYERQAREERNRKLRNQSEGPGRRSSFCLADADHCADNDPRFRGNLLCLRESTAADLREGHSQCGREGIWITWGGPGGGRDRCGIDYGAARSIEETRTHRNCVRRLLWGRDDRFWHVASLLDFIVDACGNLSCGPGQHGAA